MPWCSVLIYRTHLSSQVSLCGTRNNFSAESFLIPIDLRLCEENLGQLSYRRDKEINQIRFFINPLAASPLFTLRNRTEVVFFQCMCCIVKLPPVLDSNGSSHRWVDGGREDAGRLFRIVDTNLPEPETPLFLVPRNSDTWSLLIPLETFPSIQPVMSPLSGSGKRR